MMAGVVRRDGLREEVDACADALRRWNGEDGSLVVNAIARRLDKIAADLDAVPDVPPTSAHQHGYGGHETDPGQREPRVRHSPVIDPAYVNPTHEIPPFPDTLTADAVPDVPPDPPVADRDELARWLLDYLYPKGFAWESITESQRDKFRQDADALLSSGVLVDAADVRAREAEVRRRLEDAWDQGYLAHKDNAQAMASGRDERSNNPYRDRAVSEREGTSRPPADTDTGRGQ